MKLQDITLNHLKILKAVHDCNSFSKAAHEIGCSQSLISKKVRQLEDYFCTPLLKRSPGTIRLNSKGERLISKVYGIYKDVEVLFEEFQSEAFEPASQELTIGTTSLLAAVWFEQYLYRFALCFPEQKIYQKVTNTNHFLPSGKENFSLLISNSSAYQSQHCCNRLQTHQLFLIDFGSEAQKLSQSTLLPENINFEQIILLEEIYRDLFRSQLFRPDRLDAALITNSYQVLIETLISNNNQQSTILPGFCLAHIRQHHNILASPIQGVNEYGIYIHVPNSSELLILAESLVRSFQLEQDALDSRSKCCFYPNPKKTSEGDTVPLRIGLQRDSIGQIIAGHGVNHIAEKLRMSPPSYLSFPDTGIDLNLDLQISLFSSGDLMTRQMKKDEIEICILDDMSLLRNGSIFFDGLGFSSKLIGIASYNIAGEDISIVLPKSSEITSVHELKDKRISVSFGTNSHRFIITALDLYGYSAKADYTLIDEDSRTASNSLVNSSIDAHICCKTFSLQLEKYNFAKRLDRSHIPNIKLPSLRGIVCRSEVIRDCPQSLMTYLYYLIMANYWFLSNPIRAARTLSQLANFSCDQILSFFDTSSGNRVDPTLKPQWSWLLKTLNRRLDNQYGISKFDVDFWIDDYFLRLIYSLLDLDYHFQQVSFANEFSNSYFVDEEFSKYIAFLNSKTLT